MDEVMYGEVFGTVGKFVLHMMEDTNLAQQVPTKTLEEIIERLTEMDTHTHAARRVNNIVLIYDGAFDLEKAFTSISNTFGVVRAGFCAGTVDNHLIVYVHKKDNRVLPANLGIKDDTGTLKDPRIYRFKGFRGTGTNETTMLTLHATMSRVASNLRVIAPRGGVNYSFDQIMDILSKMDMARILLLKGRVVAKPYKQRSEFDLTFMRTYKTFMEIREMQNRQSGMMFNAYKPTMSIVPLDKLINLRSQKGTRLQEVSMRTETYDLTDLFTKPLVSKHGIVILGPTQTTGFGKTQFSLRFLSPLALHRFQEFYS